MMLADIEADALSTAIENFRATFPTVEGVVCDVADADSLEPVSTVKA